MCCEYCCNARDYERSVDDPYLRSAVGRVVEDFPFERYGVSVSPLDGRMDARLETWKQVLIDEIMDEVKDAVYVT